MDVLVLFKRYIPFATPCHWPFLIERASSPLKAKTSKTMSNAENLPLNHPSSHERNKSKDIPHTEYRGSRAVARARQSLRSFRGEATEVVPHPQSRRRAGARPGAAGLWFDSIPKFLNACSGANFSRLPPSIRFPPANFPLPPDRHVTLPGSCPCRPAAIREGTTPAPSFNPDPPQAEAYKAWL